jgi:MoxR-like ATPase
VHAQIPHQDAETAAMLQSSYKKIKSEIGKVIIGQDVIVDHLLISLLARGHCLLVGVPGLAKTLLIRTLAEVLDLKFSRIQFTPDLMPSDITGTEIIEENVSTGEKTFKFVRGPLPEKHIHSRNRSLFWRRRIRSNRKGRTRFPKHNSTGLCSICGLITRRSAKKLPL